MSSGGLSVFEELRLAQEEEAKKQRSGGLSVFSQLCLQRRLEQHRSELVTRIKSSERQRMHRDRMHCDITNAQSTVLQREQIIN